MNADIFLKYMDKLGVDFYAGVPDSQLKALCDALYGKYGVGEKHIIAANEGAAVGLAAGHFLATGRKTLVYLQNSGLGNIVNPVASLMNEKVYNIPCVYVVGWRGEPGVKDEPQHIFQGEITPALLKLLDIPFCVISPQTQEDELDTELEKYKSILESGKSVAFLIRKNALVSSQKAAYQNDYEILREDAVRCIIKNSGGSDVFVSTTGKLSRELFEIRESMGDGHQRDFLTVGSMGHASMIALGIALSQKKRRVWCLDGDGAAVMHLGSMLLCANSQCDNLVHVVMNNGAHETVGGMPVMNGKLDFGAIARTFGYKKCYSARTYKELEDCVKEIGAISENVFLEIKTSIFSRQDLGRPTTSPVENKRQLMECLCGEDCR